MLTHWSWVFLALTHRFGFEKNNLIEMFHSRSYSLTIASTILSRKNGLNSQNLQGYGIRWSRNIFCILYRKVIFCKYMDYQIVNHMWTWRVLKSYIWQSPVTTVNISRIYQSHLLMASFVEQHHDKIMKIKMVTISPVGEWAQKQRKGEYLSTCCFKKCF